MCYTAIAAMGDRATQECDPSTTAVPYGIGLAASAAPTLYDYAGGCNAINSTRDDTLLLEYPSQKKFLDNPL